MKMQASDGKFYKTDVADLETVSSDSISFKSKSQNN
jgi:hypothetical protein